MRGSPCVQKVPGPWDDGVVFFTVDAARTCHLFQRIDPQKSFHKTSMDIAVNFIIFCIYPQCENCEPRGMKLSKRTNKRLPFFIRGRTIMPNPGQSLENNRAHSPDLRRGYARAFGSSHGTDSDK